MIDLAILGLLWEQELHGYELRKRVTELAGLRPAVSFGALYPALTRLEAAGAVRVVEAVDAPAADEPVLPDRLAGRRSCGLPRPHPHPVRAHGRPRGRGASKVYGLTGAGQHSPRPDG